MLSRALLLFGLFILLEACSAHPSAGSWQATSVDTKFARLEVRYDGKADFYLQNQDKQAAWRCFWGKTGKQTIDLKCIEAGSTIEKKYKLTVSKNEQLATLMENDQVLGQYTWQAPDKA